MSRRLNVFTRFILPLTAAGAAAAALSAGAPTGAKQKQAAATPASVAISPVLPTELNAGGGGAPQATLAQAADFAWSEFIALSWPAATTDAQNKPLRDTPDTSCLLGDPRPRCAGQPLTWQTFRGKAEIFTTNGPVSNYDAPPTYVGLYPSGDPQACPNQPVPSQPAWVNLDETTQIFEDAMFAGNAPLDTSVNSQPQLIRFMAKANRLENDYYGKLVAATGNMNPALQLRAATLNYLKTKGNVPPGSVSAVSLPNNTVEIKAGWRMLNPQEAASGRFHQTRVRYYEAGGAPPVSSCYREGVWGLVALHIIQKTASAPYFIYATFEQADNITDQSGRPVEDVNGAIPGATLSNCPRGQSAPCPTTPALAFNDAPNLKAPNPTYTVPPNVTLASSNTCQPGKQIYYRNLLTQALPAGPICINYRDNIIPATIIAANQKAHAAITAYNSQNGIPGSPWLYYKLINVQYVPYSNEVPGPFPGGNEMTGQNPASFYLANIMVETNRPLQMFSGSLVNGNPGTGSNSEYDSQLGGPAGTAVHRNLYYTPAGGAPHGYNMGGCMGCHGAQGQGAGGDFSVILARGPADDPELVPSTLPPPRAMPAGRRSKARTGR